MGPAFAMDLVSSAANAVATLYTCPGGGRNHSPLFSQAIVFMVEVQRWPGSCTHSRRASSSARLERIRIRDRNHGDRRMTRFMFNCSRLALASGAGGRGSSRRSKPVRTAPWVTATSPNRRAPGTVGTWRHRDWDSSGGGDGGGQRGHRAFHCTTPAMGSMRPPPGSIRSAGYPISGAVFVSRRCP